MLSGLEGALSSACCITVAQGLGEQGEWFTVVLCGPLVLGAAGARGGQRLNMFLADEGCLSLLLFVSLRGCMLLQGTCFLFC